MIYLDHAATSFPKPAAVVAAVVDWFGRLGVSSQRGDGAAVAEVRDRVAAVRRRVGALCALPPDRVAFTSGATEALNLFLRGFLRPGDAVLTTAIEHASVVRPLVALREELGLAVEVVEPDGEGYVPAERFAAELATGRYRLAVFAHAGNVLGSVLDAGAICAAARAHGTTTLLDASQTAGALPLDVGADAVAASAHKGLHAPPGLGFLAVRAGIAVRPTKLGGTGSSTARELQPLEWPAAFESGTPNTPAILGLGAALEWLEARDGGADRRRLCGALDALAAELERRGVARALGPRGDARARLPILSVVPLQLDPAEAGMVLAGAGITVRSGHHCAPWIHERLATVAAGTVRFSPGPTVSEGDVMAAARALAP